MHFNPFLLFSLSRVLVKSSTGLTKKEENIHQNKQLGAKMTPKIMIQGFFEVGIATAVLTEMTTLHVSLISKITCR